MRVKPFKGGAATPKASPERGGAREAGGGVPFPVTATQPIGERTHLTGGTKPAETAPLERQPLFGRGGLGERRFSQRSGLSPRISITLSFREGARGRVPFLEKRHPPSQTLTQTDTSRPMIGEERPSSASCGEFRRGASRDIRWRRTIAHGDRRKPRIQNPSAASALL